MILVPSSCDFIKNKSEWKGEYNMELIPAEDSDIQTSNPCKNEKRNQRKGKMRCDFVRICSKKEDDLVMAFDFPQILKSGMSPKKVRQLFKVDYLPSQVWSPHMRTASFLVFTFTKIGLKTTKVKSTACTSKKIKTNHHRAFCATHQFLSDP